MTFDEMTRQLDELTLDEQLQFMELLVQNIRRKLKDADLIGEYNELDQIDFEN